MTLVAFIKLGRIYDSQPLQQTDWAPAERTLFQRGAFHLLPTAKLLVNHDRDREIGHVLEVTEFPDTDGNWLAARCQVDAPPDWLQKDKTHASFSYATTLSQEVNGWTRILRGVLTEVSLLTASVAPAESRAKVLVLREVPDANRSLPAAGRSSDRAAVGGVIINGVTDEEIERWESARQASLIAEGMRTRKGRAKLVCLGLLEPAF